MAGLRRTVSCARIETNSSATSGVLRCRSRAYRRALRCIAHPRYMQDTSTSAVVFTYLSHCVEGL